MAKIDSTVKRESLYVAVWIIVLSMLMQAVFLIIGKWDYTVLLGNILSGTAMFFHFFLLGITVQKAVNKDEKQAAHMMKLSQSLRTLMLFVVAVIGLALPCFSIWSTLIPFFFVRIAVAFRPMFNKKEAENNND